MHADTVAAVIFKEGKFLMVEEETPYGLRLNQPAGHVEPGETFEAAVVREAMEEACVRITPGSLLAVYTRHGKADSGEKHKHYRRHAFVAHIDEELPFENHSPEICRRLWMDIDEIRSEKARLRGDCTLETLEDFLRIRALFCPASQIDSHC